MNIGDKVKLTNTTETGVIVNILKNNQLEVELDGWNSKQTFSKDELKLISKPIENDVFTPKIKENAFEKGIFLAFVPQKLAAGESLAFYVINNSIWDIPFAITIDKSNKSTGIMAGFLKSGTFQRATNDLLIANFDEWKTLTFSAIQYCETLFETQLPISKQKKFQAHFFKTRK
jgi:hypothetical protein